MRIGGYGQYDLYSGFDAHEAINRIPQVSVDDIPQKEKEVPEKTVGSSVVNNGNERAKIQNASISSISEDMKPVSSFEFKGRESSIEDLDITKAVSDLRKDETLQQYQYFVGDINAFVNTEDGIVIQKS